MMFETPVYAIPPFYREFEEKLDHTSMSEYLEFLEGKGVDVVMTTAGTSQFNLLSDEEVRELNQTVLRSFSKHTILGLKPTSEKFMKEEILWYNELTKGSDNVYLILLYPDRFYTEDNVSDFFHRMADYSDNPIFVHGQNMRKGNGGSYDFTPTLINKIASHPNIVGMKEECTSLPIGWKMINGIESIDHFEVIVAGGSQNRHWYLQSAGADNFLTGIGNFFPEIENTYYQWIQKGEYGLAMRWINEYETELFNVFMEIGWHKSMREALRILGFNKGSDRKPFEEATDEESEKIKKIIKKIQIKYYE